jgi:hypothetical protein
MDWGSVDSPTERNIHPILSTPRDSQSGLSSRENRVRAVVLGGDGGRGASPRAARFESICSAFYERCTAHLTGPKARTPARVLGPPRAPACVLASRRLAVMSRSRCSITDSPFGRGCPSTAGACRHRKTVVLQMQPSDHPRGGRHQVERAKGVGNEIRMQFPITAYRAPDLGLRLE